MAYNRIREIRKSKGLTASRLAEMIGVTQSAISKIESSQSEINLSRLFEIANALNVHPTVLISPNSVKIPVSGFVGAGAEVFPFDDLSDEQFPDTVSVPIALGHVTIVKVKGDSMAPRYYDGDCVAYGAKAPSLEEAIGKECVVRLTDGRLYLKQVRPGTEAGKAMLLSVNADPIVNVELDWAAPLVDWIKRG